jgi:hypothetical protein
MIINYAYELKDNEHILWYEIIYIFVKNYLLCIFI